MRILFVNRHLGYQGGVEQHVADSARALRLRGHACHLAHGESRRDPVAYARSFDGCTPCAELFDAPAAQTLARPLADIARDASCDLIYLHKASDAALESALSSGIPAVGMIHDHDLCCPRRHKYFSWNGAICNHPAGWRCWADAAFIERDRTSPLGVRWSSIPRKIAAMRRWWEIPRLLVGSAFMRDELVMNGYAPERIRIVPPGVDLPLPAEPPAAPAAGHPPNLLFVGQLIRGKGADILLRALPLMKVCSALRLAGEGNQRAELESLAAELALGPRVEFLGWIDHARLPELLAWSRALVVPSRWPEPFGMVGIEAMMHARPIVGLASGGIPDWLEDGVNGLLVADPEPAALALALDRILSDDGLARRLGEGGLARAGTLFAFDRLVGQLEVALCLKS